MRIIILINCIFFFTDPEIRGSLHHLWPTHANHLLEAISGARDIGHQCELLTLFYLFIYYFFFPALMCLIYFCFLPFNLLYSHVTLVAIWLQGKKLGPGPSPASLSSNNLISLVTPVLYDTPKYGRNFGDCVQQPAKLAKTGDRVVAVFVSIRYIYIFHQCQKTKNKQRDIKNNVNWKKWVAKQFPLGLLYSSEYTRPAL